MDRSFQGEADLAVFDLIVITLPQRSPSVTEQDWKALMQELKLPSTSVYLLITFTFPLVVRLLFFGAPFRSPQPLIKESSSQVTRYFELTSVLVDTHCYAF